MSLSDLAIRQASPRVKAYKLADSGGLFLYVKSNGSKIWRFKYRFDGKEKLLSLGIYPTTTLVKAREKRDQFKDSLVTGIDPGEVSAEEKRRLRYKQEQTFELVAREWHKRFYDTWSERYADEILNKLEMNVFPQFGKKPISETGIRDTILCLQIIEDRKAHDQARRVGRIIGQVMRYATQTERAERDFTVDLKGALKRYNSGHYACISKDEIPGFLKALYNNTVRLYPTTIIAVKLLMLTGVRTRELTEAKWSEFDLTKSLWVIPATRMKNKREHIVPLSRQVMELLIELKTLHSGREYILPSVCRSNKHMSNNTILKALALLGYEKKMTGHGFRSMFMSTLKEETSSEMFRHEVIDRQLSHVPKDKIQKAYDRAEYLEDRVKLMQFWADLLDEFRLRT